MCWEQYNSKYSTIMSTLYDTTTTANYVLYSSRYVCTTTLTIKQINKCYCSCVAGCRAVRHALINFYSTVFFLLNANIPNEQGLCVGVIRKESDPKCVFNKSLDFNCLNEHWWHVELEYRFLVINWHKGIPAFLVLRRLRQVFACCHVALPRPTEFVQSVRFVLFYHDEYHLIMPRIEGTCLNCFGLENV